MEVNLHWRDIDNLISGIGGWKQRENLDMNHFYIMRDELQKYGGGGVIWHTGNSSIVLISWKKNTSIIDLQTDNNESANMKSLETWNNLKVLLSQYEILQECENRKLPIKLTSRQKGLNKLSESWAELNNGHKEKRYTMNDFLNDEAQLQGLHMVTEFEFKKHLPMAVRWGVIDQNPKTKRFIPKKR